MSCGIAAIRFGAPKEMENLSCFRNLQWLPESARQIERNQPSWNLNFTFAIVYFAKFSHPRDKSFCSVTLVAVERYPWGVTYLFSVEILRLGTWLFQRQWYLDLVLELERTMVHSDNEVSVLRNGGSGAPGITLGSNGGAGGGLDSGQIGQIGQTQRIQNYF